MTRLGTICSNLQPFLSSSAIIDWHQPDVQTLAGELRDGSSTQQEVARQCFEWVRDNVQHSVDFGRVEVTCKASDVLNARTGFCYAKSHLLAALLRANNIPCGLCYQRLSIDGSGSPFCLHGLNALYLGDGIGWYRVDARGDTDEIRTGCAPPKEELAFSITLPGEFDYPDVWPEPLPVVVDSLRRHKSVQALQHDLPDANNLSA